MKTTQEDPQKSRCTVPADRNTGRHTLKPGFYALKFVLLVSVILMGCCLGDVRGAPTPTGTPALKDNISDQTSSSFVDLGDGDVFAKSARALTMFLVVAVLLESAFALIFNWRIYQMYFNSRGLRSLIMVVASLMVVSVFHLDILRALIEAYTNSIGENPKLGEPAWISQFISALILAGGSGGVHRIMQALGYRSKVENRVQREPAPDDKAWISIVLQGDTAGMKPPLVRIREMGPLESSATTIPIAGSIPFERPNVVDVLFRNPKRFPQGGGYTVKALTRYKISVEPNQADAERVTIDGLHSDDYVFAQRAVVDIELTCRRKV